MNNIVKVDELSNEFLSRLSINLNQLEVWIFSGTYLNKRYPYEVNTLSNGHFVLDSCYKLDDTIHNTRGYCDYREVVQYLEAIKG